VSFVTAHNAAFDYKVLVACCSAARIPVPRKPWVCSMHLARTKAGLTSLKLVDVCAALGVPLEHPHDALSDAEACARVVLHLYDSRKPPGVASLKNEDASRCREVSLTTRRPSSRGPCRRL